MAFRVVTESHGTIEAGYSALFLQYAQLGDYYFTTKHLCGLIQTLAENPAIKEAQIISYDEKKFWERGKEFRMKFGAMLQDEAEKEERYLPELYHDIEKEIQDTQGEISLEDDLDMGDEGVNILVKVEDNFIIIGQYKISSIHFGRFSYYIAHGGNFGWMDDVVPPYAAATMKAIKESESGLFKYIKDEMED